VLVLWGAVALFAALVLLLLLGKTFRRERYRIVPLDEPLRSRYAKVPCVFYRTEVLRVMRDGSTEVLFEEERGVNFIVVDEEGLPVSVRLKPRKVHERFVRARHLSPDPFAYMCRTRPLILDDTLGIVIREYAIPVGRISSPTPDSGPAGTRL